MRYGKEARRPNRVQIPSPQDADICVAPRLPTLNDEPDPEDKNHLLASDTFDDDCTLYGLSLSAGIEKRSLIKLPWEEELRDVYNFNSSISPLTDYRHALRRRTLAKTGLKFCLPGNVPGPDMRPTTYPGLQSLVRVGKTFIHVAKPWLCGDIGLSESKVAPKGVKFVVEHVFEKQTLRNAFQYMVQGTVAGGKALSHGAARAAGVFDTAQAVRSLWLYVPFVSYTI